MGFYDGTKLLSLKDTNGKKPEIYICTSNRSGGKTTYFSRWAVNRYKQYGEKFCLLYRYKYELGDCADKFFKDINGLFFPKDDFQAEIRANGVFMELFLNEESCGYALALSGADSIKKYSHMLSDTERILFDEFQSETNRYCAEEVKKLLSIHTSIARGQGKQRRYVPIIMISNPVSLINPYYTELGISSLLKKDTKFLKGDGFVMEQGYNETAAGLAKDSGVMRAFGNSSYIAYATEGVYLNDSLAFIDKPKGKSRYILTICYKGKEFAIREFVNDGVVYVDTSVDNTFPNRLAVTLADHNINYVMLKQNTFTISNLRFLFEHGAFRFKDLQCKEALIKCISY